MAHFAEIDENNFVIRVLVVDDEQEHRGHDFLSNDLGLGGRWIKTSYNTYGGVHYTDGLPSEDQSKSLRKNFASAGYFYDEDLDAFIPPAPDDSWELNKDTCLWHFPTPTIDQ